MERADVIAVVEKYLIRAVEGVTPGQMDPQKKFTEYGANSLDIVEIVSSTMRELKVKIPRTELADIKDINGLIDKIISCASHVN